MGNIQNKDNIMPGDIVTLKNGKKGKVSYLLSTNGRYMISGKNKEPVHFNFDDAVTFARPPVKQVRIYQITETGYNLKHEDYIFRDYANIKAKKRSAPPADIYEVVFDGALGTENLEEIYYIFNETHPKGYRGRSLAPSDIIELYNDNGSSFFYCNTVGFKKIRFKPVKFQYMLIAQNERNIEDIQIFPNVAEAQHRMETELLEKIGGSFDKYEKGDEYGINRMSAWSNPGSNWDWSIIRLTSDNNFNIKII